MKLLLTMNLPYTRAHGGANRSNRGLCAGLARSGHQVRVVVPALATPTTITLDQLRAELVADGIVVDSQPGVEVFKLDGVEVYAVTEQSRLRLTLVEQLRDYAPDWALVSSEDPSQSLLDAAHKSAPGRVVYLAHSPPLYPFGPESLYPGDTRTELVRQAAGTVTISKWAADYVKRWSGIDAVPIHFPHYGTPPWPNLARFDNPYVLLMNASDVKGLPIFLQLADALPHIQFAALRGYATTPADLATMAARPNVTLLPNVPDLDDIFRQTRILLMPSLWLESFGMATVDSMLRGIPVLAAAFGGLLEAKLGTDYLLPVRPIEKFQEELGDNMLPKPVVPDQDIGPWLDSLSALLTDRALYDRQSAAARDAATAFAAGLNADQFIDWLGTLENRPVSAATPAKPAPAPATAAANLAALTPQQRAMLVERLKKKGPAKASGSEESKPIPTVSRDRRLPLSYAQERLWFLDQLQPGSTAYNIPGGMGLGGQVNVAVLRASFQELIRRHESLRTSFGALAGEPFQIIAEQVEVELPETDLRSLPEAESRAEASRLAAVEYGQSFDLGNGPLLRSRLIRVSESESLLLLTMHHIISDGWSMRVCYRELFAVYHAYLRGESSPLPMLPIQYADYAVWQREYLQGEVLERQLSYWKKQLAGAPALLNLPADRPRPKVQSTRGAAETFRLPRELSTALRELSRREGVTLFMTLLAAFQVLLHKYSGQEDVVVGSPIAGRNRREVEGLIGFCVNTLVLRTNVSGHTSFNQLLNQVKEVCLGAYAHQDLPFERLVEELQPERTLSHNPIFQVVFELANESPGGKQTAARRDSESWVQDSRATAIFELVLSLRDTGEHLEGVIEYSTDLFNSETIIRLARHFGVLLASIVQDPARAVASLPILSAQEERQLLRDGANGSGIDYPRRQCLHHLFETQAQRLPNSPAVSFEGRTISYGELNRRSNQLAHYLQTLAVGPEKLVAISLERGIEMVVAMLAVLKAGAAYVPIDPALPAERVNYLLQDAGSRVLLTTAEHRPALAHGAVEIIYLDSDWKAVSRHPEDNCVADVRPENLAYVMYTSGSTGKPKGVAITHENLNWLVHNLDELEIKAGDTVALASHPSFDAVVYEIWCGLVHGARLEVIGNGIILSTAEFREKLHSTGVSVLYVTAAIFTQLASDDPTIFSSVRTVVSGGESIVERWAQEVLERGRPEKLIHEYGPTEATVFSSIQVVEGQASGEAKRGERNLPIGKPLSNTRSYVLDGEMRPVPVGICGELYIGGPGVARGYWGVAEQTARAFVPDPHSEDAGARLYRTGDMVKWRAPGVLEFAGRVDSQVKLRGYRIELGEIEAALSACAGVKESVVIAREEPGQEKRLVGYVVAEEGSLLTGEALRRRLREQLPEYMVPSVVMPVERIPLTANGKVDRKALPAPGTKPHETGADNDAGEGSDYPELWLRVAGPQEAARGQAVVELLAGIWEELLQVEEVQVGDNFFVLGGHSLMVMRLISRIREVFSTEISPRSVFEAPTLGMLAEEIEEARREGRGVEGGPLTPVARSEHLPLSYAQQRLWFLEQLQPGSTAYNIPGGLGLSGQVNVPALRASFQELIRRHESLRTSFGALAGEPLQIIAESLEVELPEIDLRAMGKAESRTEALRLAAAEGAQSFDLASGPLLRSRLIRVSDDECLMLLTMHHIISDGWSMRVLYRELFTLYHAYQRGQPSPLGELPIQYADYAVWQREYLQGEVLARQLNYWKQQLAGAPALLDLPTDKPRPNVQTTRGAAETFRLPPELSVALRQLSRREGVTLFMALLAAFQVLLHKYSGQEDVVIGSPIAGRNRREVEGLIGFFVNTLALRTKLSGDPNFSQLLKQVREVCLGAYAHQDLPFERLVEELQPERSLSHSPIFQVMFELENARPGNRQSASAKDSESWAVNKGETAIFELVLSIRDTGQHLEGVIEYSTDLFNAETIVRMAQHLEGLLEQLAANPQLTISQLTLPSASERRLLLSEWSGADVRHKSEARLKSSLDQLLVHNLFEQQVARTPDAIALSYEDVTFSYDELNRSANQLARLLISQGIAPESLVGIALPRSPELVVAMLATLKVGAAYLPLDPDYPPDRLSLMLADAGVSLLLTGSEVQPRLPGTTSPIVCLDEALTSCRRYPDDNLAVGVSPENLAYVIYTSGSTGAPKGVMISHAALAEYAPIAAERFGLTAADRFLQFASSSFDVAVEEIFPTLVAGGRLVLFRGAPYGGEFTQLLADEGVTICELPTAYWQEWVRQLIAGKQEAPAALRLIIVGGEKNTAESVRRWRKVSGGRVRLLHVYGVTEATVTTSLYELGAGLVSAESEEVMPLGGLLRNSEVYVLDKRLEPAPTGVYGELYLGGSNLARGYRGQAETTAEKYVPHLYGRHPGERLYRTGDIVRWRGNGLLEFAGRVDGQVKVRGFRIELGEIETVLKRHPSIRDAVAAVIEKDEGDHRIIAYIVFRQHARKTESRKLRQYLKERLPAYMAPSLFITVDQLPLTPNGKIDRAALPTPDWAEVDAQKSYVGPNGTTELRLQQIWESIFGIHPISVTDDFFELGGHSLLAVRLVSAIHRHFGCDLPLSVLFQGATIERLNNIISNTERTNLASPLVGLRLGGVKRPFFCAHGVGGNVVSYLQLAEELGPDQVFYGIQTPLQEFGAQFASLEEMAASYVKEIREVQPEGPYQLGGWSMGGIIAFEMALQLHRQGQKVGLLAIMDVGPPADEIDADIEDADLIKVALEFTIDSFNISQNLFEGDWEHIMKLPSDERLRFVIGKAQAAKALPRDFGLEQVRRVYDQININFRLLRDYKPQVYPGQIVFFKAENCVFENEVETLRAAWAALSTEELTMHLFPCTHFEMVTKPDQVEHLAALLQGYFEQVEEHERFAALEQEEPVLMLAN